MLLKFMFLFCSECEPYTERACRDAANYNKLIIGSGFAGKFYGNYGCYAYSSGKYNGRVYYGTGGTLSQKKSLLGGNKYRPVGHDCNYPGIKIKVI